MLCVCQTSAAGALPEIVTNTDGEPIGGVHVSLINRETGQFRDTATSSGGDDSFVLPPPGNYQMGFSIAGFNTTEGIYCL